MREPASELDGIGFHVDEGRPRTGTVVLAVRGDADLHVAPELRDRIGAAMAGGTSELVLDLTETTFVDSTTLGVLIGAMKAMRSGGGRLRLVVARQELRRVFEIALLDGVFPMHGSLGEALAAEAAGTGGVG